MKPHKRQCIDPANKSIDQSAPLKKKIKTVQVHGFLGLWFSQPNMSLYARGRISVVIAMAEKAYPVVFHVARK